MMETSEMAIGMPEVLILMASGVLADLVTLFAMF